jgi:hypothetical protein
MDVSAAIALLKEGELKQLAVKDDVDAVTGYINLGILEIHKRFNLWQEEAKITMLEGVTRYALDGIDPNVGIDLTDHDVVMVDEAYTPAGDLLSLNDEKDPYGIFTPKPHVIEVLVPIITGDVSIIYRASPKFLVHETQTIPLPPQFLEALFNYVGWRGHGSVKGDIKSENNTHYMRFEQSIKIIKENGLVAADDMASNKFEDRGFV